MSKAIIAAAMATPLRQKALELIQAKGRVSTAEMLTALTEGTEASKTFVKMHVLGPLRRKGLVWPSNERKWRNVASP